MVCFERDWFGGRRREEDDEKERRQCVLEKDYLKFSYEAMQMTLVNSASSTKISFPFLFRFRVCGKWKLPCEKRRKTFSFSFFQGLFLVNNNSKLPQTKVLALLPCGWLPRKITSVCDQNIYAAPRLVSSSARWFEFLVKVMSSYKI